MEEEKDVVKSKKGNNKVIVILLLIVIAVLAIIIYMLLHKKEEPENRNASEGLIVDETVPDDDVTFTTDMNMTWTFPSGKRTSVDALIGNSDLNKHEVYFEVYLDDEEQTLLYSSPVIPIGKQLDKLKLDKVLPDGIYPALCTFHLLDKKNPDEEVGKVSFNVTLIFLAEKSS